MELDEHQEHFKNLTWDWLKSSFDNDQNLFNTFLEKIPTDKLQKFLDLGAFGAVMIEGINSSTVSYYQSLRVK